MSEPITNAMSTDPTALQSQCDLLRSLQVQGHPLVLPNVWDAATARTVVAAGFPVVATTSAGVTRGSGL
jgi:2-methylisocitrate lyase-like PEP mutase family enzyme